MATLDELLQDKAAAAAGGGGGRPVRILIYDLFLPCARDMARRHGSGVLSRPEIPEQNSKQNVH